MSQNSKGCCCYQLLRGKEDQLAHLNIAVLCQINVHNLILTAFYLLMLFLIFSVSCESNEATTIVFCLTTTYMLYMGSSHTWIPFSAASFYCIKQLIGT